MAMKVYLRAATATPTVGTDETHDCENAFGSTATATQYSRGTVAGPATQQFTDGAGGTPMSWVSPPLASAITISGSITVNLRGKVDVSANCTLCAQVMRANNSGVIQSNLISAPPTTHPAALTTSEAAINYSATPTSTSFLVGDRIVVQVYITDATTLTMLSGHTVTLFIDANFGMTASGDSWIQFTEQLAFQVGGGVWAVPPANVPLYSDRVGYLWPGTSGQQIVATGIDPAQP